MTGYGGDQYSGIGGKNGESAAYERPSDLIVRPIVPATGSFGISGA